MAAADVDYEFRGLRDIESYSRSFFDSIEKTMETHPAWRYGSEATLLAARDGIEKYVMLKLRPHVLGKDPLELEDDVRLARRTRALSFITADHLDIKPAIPSDHANPENWVGESECWASKKWPMLSIAGLAPHFHACGDLPEAVTSPGLLATTIDVIGDAALTLANHEKI